MVVKSKKSLWLLVLLLAIAAGCTPVILHQLDQRFGAPDSTRYAQPKPPVPGAPEYWHDVRPLLEQRCTVCHGCYDAPCQQNLTSWDGIARGANADPVYSNRLREAAPSRLFIDAQSPMEWRNRQFHPVLNERADTREANLAGSVLYRLLDLKRQHPLPAQTVLDPEVFTFDLNRKQSCPKIETFDAFAKEHKEWGMPYGLPGLSDKEFSTMEAWLAAGSPVGAKPAIPAVTLQQVNHWENFLNGSTAKQRLMSRYLYEHLFLAHLYFDPDTLRGVHDRQFFRLVRSSTPPGTPIAEIATRRPYDDPGVTDFWYRLRLDEGSVVEKTHMPYLLDKARQEKWEQWFLKKDYAVSSLPSYAIEVASNPFVAFQAIPVDSRYRFLLDEAQFSVDNFIKGPVCRGQVALGVIDDHTWVFFVDPDQLPAEETASFLASQSRHLRLPAEDESNARVVDWLKYSRLQKEFLKAKAQEMTKVAGKRRGFSEDFLWDGGKDNHNAALTVFRHTDSASVLKGLVGPPPKTAWVLSYALLERIHYLLVAGYDVYGSLGHQLNTRLYMDFMRMEGEANFLALLPLQARGPMADYWYRDAGDDVKAYLHGEHFNYNVETGIHYHTDNPQQELYGILAKHIGKNLDKSYQLDKVKDAALRRSLERLQRVRGEALSFMPQNSILRVDEANGQRRYFTLVNNSGYSNISELLGSDKRRRPAEDNLSVAPGIVGAYPNAFFRIDRNALDRFTDSIAALKSDADFAALAASAGVRRTSPDFWAFSDTLQRDYLMQEPLSGGILDYNRLENR